MSYTCIHYHLIFATKDRKPFLLPPLKEEVNRYLSGILTNKKSKLYIINGPEDHIHMLVSPAAELSLAELVRTLKSNSSKWIHDTFPQHRDFAWQEGYSAFSVSLSAVGDVIKYIQNQEEHHKKISFRDELIRFLEAHQIEYDPKYLP